MFTSLEIVGSIKPSRAVHICARRERILITGFTINSAATIRCILRLRYELGQKMSLDVCVIKVPDSRDWRSFTEEIGHLLEAEGFSIVGVRFDADS
jgi:hypothetical protein